MSGNATANSSGRFNWTALIAHRIPRVELTAGRIAGIYILFGMAALVVSDVVFVTYLSEPLLSQVQAVKGGVEVLLSGGLIFLLTRRSRGQLHDAAEEIEQHRNELQFLHRVFRHNLRNDLNIIQGHADFPDHKTVSAEIRSRCEHVLDTTEKMTTYIDEIRRIRQVTGGNAQVKRLSLSTTIHSMLDDHPHVTDDVIVTTSIPDDVDVEVNYMLDAAIHELVTNAITHTTDRVPVVTITVDPDAGPPGMVEVRIADNGPGLPAAEVDALEGNRDSQLHHSTGLGLWFVDWVITHSSGDLAVISADESGTELRIRLPRAGGPSFDTVPLTPT